MKTSMIFMMAAAAFATLVGLAPDAKAEAFALTSPDVTADLTIAQTFAFNGFGCTGQNVSPALAWSHVPAGTKSLAVMVHDPDAQTGGAGFWHWVVVNLPAASKGLARGAGTREGLGLPEPAFQIATDFGTPGWGGPCPPAGDTPHRYRFTVYALKVERLDLPANATASLAGFIVNANAIGRASFTARYGR